MLPLGQQENGMSQDDPLVCLALLGCAIWIGKQWLDDFRSKDPNALPGATPCSQTGVWIAITGALSDFGFGDIWRVDNEAGGRTVHHSLVFSGCHGSGGSSRGTRISWIFGNLQKGRVFLVTSAVGFSLLFALAHLPLDIQQRRRTKHAFK